MSCAGCGHENRPGRKFCVECGAALALACAACSAPYEAGEKFCGECGAPLGVAAPRPIAGVERGAETGAAPAGRPATDGGARQVVTIVFADLVGSTALHERLDAESARRVMERYYEALRAAVDAHGGTVVKLLGDGVMAAFGLKRVTEDDALRAVRAAAAMQETFRALIRTEAAALGAAGLRVAVNTGEVVVSGARDDVIGDPVNVAARLQEQGGDGDVVLGEATRRLVATRVTLAPLGSVTLKGRAEAVAAYRLVSLEPPAGGAAVPFVGREDELARLEAVYAAAVATPATRLVVLLGSPGLGKSRMIDELGRRHADDATILVAHCDAAGGATFEPLAQVLRGFLGLDEGAAGDAVRAAVAAALAAGDPSDRTRIAGGIAGLLRGTATSPEETFFAVRRFLAGLAAARPVVLVIDDLHWAEPLLLDLLEHLVQWGSGVRLFVLVGARPELRDLRSSLVVPGSLVADVVTLAGLDAGAAMRLAANVIGAGDLPAVVAAKVLATSEGNPLFVSELVRMLVQEGVLTKEGERWTAAAGLAALEMPPTIHALLAARIERLGPEERLVLERASVVGRHFSRSAVAALLGRNGSHPDARETSELDARLESLRRSELIERDTGWLLGEPVLRFHHVLIRDAAYRRLLKGTRAELHGRLADWIEARVGDAPEHDEMIGWHLEQGHQLLGELGPLDAAGVVLGERAARRLAAAGRRALARDDVSLAAGLCGRALDRLTPEAPERADLVLDWCEALLAAGDVGPAADAIAELDRLASDPSKRIASDASDHVAGDGSDAIAAAARLRAWHTCFAGQLTVLTAPEALHLTAERVGAAARELAALNDASGEAKAHFVHAQALARLGKVGACEAALDQALAAARRAGDRRRANAVLAGAPLAALWGPSPVTRASGRCLDVVRVLRITQGAPAVEAVALSCQGVLEALRGRIEAARRMLASSRTMVEELGISHRLFETDVFAGRIDLLEGDAPAAERALRAGYDGLRELGLGIDAARAAALLGRALLAQDRAAEAETLSHESELLAGDDLQAAIAWRGVRAEALARRGDHAAAIAFAEAAVAIAAATDALLDHADARLALAAALRAGGRRPEADAEERRAFELWEAKGATVLADQARRTRPPVASSEAKPDDRETLAPPVARRVGANDASTLIARFEATFAAGDGDAVAALWADALEVVDHPNGAAYDRDGHLASVRRFQRARDPKMGFEVVATLGSSLCLARRRIAASGTIGGRFDVGESEHEAFVLVEVDERRTGRRIEIFSADHLGDAIARLYQRYAEALPPGPERERAAVTARAVAFMVTQTPGPVPDFDEFLAPTNVTVDHRSVGYGTLKGGEASKLLTSWRELSEGLRVHVDELLALEPHGFLRMTTSSGVWREGGGAFERTVCMLSVFGPDGRVTHHETFDAERAADALARFDALTADAAPASSIPSPLRAPRAPRPNAVTRVSAEFEGIVAARDFAALETFFAEDVECIDHPYGATYGAAGMRAGMRGLMQSPDARLRFVPLATLGDSWGLVRREMSASGAVSGRFDVGAYEIVDVAVYGTDARGRLRHVELFAAERLGAAIVGLYERYAERLPAGPAAERARAIARSLAVFDGPIELDRIADTYAPAFEAVDQRILGTWSAHGREEWLRQWRAQFGLADESRGRYDAVLALEPTATLVHQTFSGIGRESGGDFEHVILVLYTFGADGRIARVELFEPERAAEALARFDALTAEGAPQQPMPRRVRPPRALRANAASRTGAAIEAAFARRDLAAVDALLGDPLATIEHPTGTTYGREGALESSRRMMRMPDLIMRLEPLATLGDSLCLARRVVTASGTAGSRFDVGAYEIESIVVNAVDAAGRLGSSEVFASDHLCQALGRLYAFYAESLPDGPERTRAAGIASSHAAFDGPIDADRVADVGVAPSYVCVDHRSLGTWSSQGREECRRHYRGQTELAAGFFRRDEDILAFTPAVNVMRNTYYGTGRASGGPFENVILSVSVFDADGRLARVEVFEPDQEAAALARFDELVAGTEPEAPVARPVRPPRPVRATAATRSLTRLQSVVAARDREALGDLFAEDLHFTHHPTGATYGRRETLGKWRSIIKAEQVTFHSEVLASLGETLALERHSLVIDGLRDEHYTDFGRLQFDEAVVIEVDDAGRWCHVELFEAERLGDAIACLYARHAERLPDGPERARATMAARAAATMLTRSTEHRLEDVSAPDFQAVDHRTVGIGTATGSGFWQRWRAATDELTQDQTYRVEDVLALGADGLLRRTIEMGTVRASGGAFENSVWILSIFGPDGRQARLELFDAGREAEALARYHALVGPPGEPATGAPSDPDFANAATRAGERFVRAMNGRDWEAVRDLFAESLRWEDRRPLFRMQLGKEGCLEQLRLLFDVPNGRWTATPIATRGERLMLSRLLLQGQVPDGGGALKIEYLYVAEVGEDGRHIAIVLFEPADLDAAYTELDARYEAGEGAMHPPVFSGFSRAIARRDWDAVTAMCGPRFVEQDHRSLALLGTTPDPEAWANNFRVQVDLAPDTAARFEHVRPSPRGSLWTLTWEGSRDGGRYEIPMVGVTELDGQGKLARVDLYDPEQLDQARTRFAELTAPAPPAEPFANAATRSRDRFARATAARDWDGLADLTAASLRFDDRRPLFQMQLGKEGYLQQYRVLFDVPNARLVVPTIATRGERLTLSQILFQGDVAGGGGALEIDHLGVIEVDDDGRITAIVVFEPGELDAAYAELEARYVSGEGAMQRGAAGFSRAIARRDWDAIAAICGPGFVEHDHRRLALLGTSPNAEAWVHNFRVLVDLAPDTVARFEHVRPCPRGNFFTLTWAGSRDGGRYEIPLVGVTELDGQGKLARVDFYDPEQIDQARARFAELAAAAPSAGPFANAATRSLDRFARATDARDWDGLADLTAASLRFDDRRPLFQMQLGKEGFLQQHRVLFDVPNARWVIRTIATRGERLTLSQVLLRGDVAGGGGALEIDHLGVIEVDDDGRITAIVLFEPGKLDAAYAELDARWQASEAGLHPRVEAYRTAYARALAERDWETLVSLHAPGLVAHDHRLVGWDELRGPDGYVGAMRAMVDLAPDAQGRLDHLRTSEGGLLAEVVWVGTRDGGAFESPFLWVVEIDEAGLAQRLDFYDPHHLDAARARFAEVDRRAPRAALERTASGPALVAAPANAASTRDPFEAIATPNLASAWWDRSLPAYAAGFDTGNWDAMRACVAPGCGTVLDDRRRLALVSGDAELFIAALRERVAMGARPAATLVGTAGERIAIDRILWSGGPSDGRFEIEYLAVVEVDAAGRLITLVLYDLDDARAALREAWTRWAAIDPGVAGLLRILAEVRAGFDGHDRARLRAIVADEVIAEDHRWTGFGRLEGAAYLDSIVALWELAPDQRIEFGWFWPAVGPHGAVTSVRREGTLPDGGGAFESVYLFLFVVLDGRITRIGNFELDAVEAALARFEALRPDPLRIPPNAATRAIDRRTSAFEARDWEALRGLCAASLVFEDRRWIAQTIGDPEMFVASNQLVGDVGGRVVRTVLATAGDRLALERAHFAAGEVGGEIEVDSLVVSEIDGDGRLIAIVFFDPGDRATASAELFERYAASGADGATLAALDVGRAWNAHDMARLRELLPADFYLEDHRRTGVGRLDGREAYLESLAALWALSRDVRIETLYTIEVASHGRLYVNRWFGTNAEGGEFDAVYVCVVVAGGERMGLEIFELDDLAAARARFAALRPDPR